MNTNIGVSYPVPQVIKPRWCKYGEHYFNTSNRMQVCCDDAKCRERQRDAQKIRDRKTYRVRKNRKGNR